MVTRAARGGAEVAVCPQEGLCAPQVLLTPEALVGCDPHVNMPTPGLVV